MTNSFKPGDVVRLNEGLQKAIEQVYSYQNDDGYTYGIHNNRIRREDARKEYTVLRLGDARNKRQDVAVYFTNRTWRYTHELELVYRPKSPLVTTKRPRRRLQV